MLWFEEEHIKKNSGWNVGFFGFGIPNQNQSCESFHKVIGASLRKCAQREHKGARLPGPVKFIANVLFNSVTRDISESMFETTFDVEPEPTATDERQAFALMADPKLLKYKEDIFACRQKVTGGQLYVITKK